MLKGLDISMWQRGIDLSKIEFDFVIIKATEGANIKDSCAAGYISQLTGTDKLIGLYHYARPSKNTAETEAKYFVNRVRELDMVGKAILALDWEGDEVNGKNQWALDWCNHVSELTGAIPLVYCNQSQWTSNGLAYITRNYPLWLANWSSYSPNVEYAIWQYTSTGKLNGYSGNLDLDQANITRERWEELAGWVQTAPKLDEYEQWAIDNGIFKGRSDGHYDWSTNITRHEIAIVLKRFYDKFIK